MLTQDFDFEVPDELVAQTPAPERQQARLLVARPGEAPIEHRSFGDLPEVVRQLKANGTVNPSDIPITMSVIKSEFFKCFS